MALGGCYSCIKYLMFGFNFLFWLLGCAILGVGFWVRVDPNFKQYVDNSGAINYLYKGAHIFIAVGVIVMVIGFLGCCGAIRESQCMLVTFFVFLFVIFVVLLGAGIWVIVAQDVVQQSVTESLPNGVKNHYDTTTPSARNLMDNVQTNFACCGADKGAADYLALFVSVPKTCDIADYASPCGNKLFTYFKENLVIVAGIAIGIGIVMLLGMLSLLRHQT